MTARERMAVAGVCVLACLFGVGTADARPAKCVTNTVHATIGIDRETVVLSRVTVCADGTVTLTGRGARWHKPVGGAK